jgi:hypothetical protein
MIEVHEVEAKLLLPRHIHSHDESSWAKQGHILFRNPIKDSFDMFRYCMSERVLQWRNNIPYEAIPVFLPYAKFLQRSRIRESKGEVIVSKARICRPRGSIFTAWDGSTTPVAGLEALFTLMQKYLASFTNIFLST